jgi:hypothetical protein
MEAEEPKEAKDLKKVEDL